MSENFGVLAFLCQSEESLRAEIVYLYRLVKSQIEINRRCIVDDDIDVLNDISKLFLIKYESVISLRNG